MEKFKNYITFNEGQAPAIGLRGVIGEEINGHYLAEAIAYLSKEYEEIELNINSEGGSVFQGLSVIAEMRKSPANITVNIDGIAASMAGVIAVCGDVVNIVDYGQIMVHDPHFGRKPRNNKEKNALNAIKNTLVKVFEGRDIDTEVLTDLMTKESWLSAEDCKELNLIDNIVSTGKVVDFMSFETVAQMVACAEKVATATETKTEIMKDVLNHFGLSEDAKENDVLNKIQEIENVRVESEAKNAELSNKLEEANKELAKIKVNNAIEAGKITEEKREQMQEIAFNTPEAFDALIEAVEIKPVNVANLVNSNDEPKAKKASDYTEEELKDLMNSNPELYNEIFNQL